MKSIKLVFLLIGAIGMWMSCSTNEEYKKSAEIVSRSLAASHEERDTGFCSIKKLTLVELKDSMMFGQQGEGAIYRNEVEIYYYESGQIAALRRISWNVEVSVDPETL